MNIGDVAVVSGLPAKTIRYYEEIGLVVPPRAGNGYRAYRDRDAHMLRFIARARSLGFSIEDCRALLSLYEDQARASADVKRLAKAHLAEIDAKIAELREMRGALGHLVTECQGDARPDCPILDELAGSQGAKRA